MICLERVAYEIKNVGLYDLVLQDALKLALAQTLSQEQIQKLLEEYPEILEAYKQTNVEYNISNIHLRTINTEDVPFTCKDKAKRINTNLARLSELEKYTLDFEQSSILVIIMSIEFFVLFSVQYFIVLLGLKSWQWEIYGTFALSVVVAWIYAKKERKKFERNKEVFIHLYDETMGLLHELEDEGEICINDLMIRSSDEHV